MYWCAYKDCTSAKHSFHLLMVTLHCCPSPTYHYSEWTTEKEINFFSDWNISGEVSQTIDGNKLSNLIEFRKGGFLGVSGDLSLPERDGSGDRMIRTNFVFSSATLDLGRWGSFQVPPVGEGWFETMYLDDTIRVDTNSRDDILICTPK